MRKYKESGDILSDCQIFGTIPKYIYIHGLYRYEVCSENNGFFFISRVWRVLLSNFFFIILVYMPLKYDKIFSYIHYSLCLWQPLRLDVFLWARRFSFVKRNRSKNFGYETRGSKIFFKIVELWTKTAANGSCSDMAPCDFLLFPKIKSALKGRRFTAIDDMISASLKEIKAILKIELEKRFEDWKTRWHKCIISNEDYFEGDNINVDG